MCGIIYQDPVSSPQREPEWQRGLLPEKTPLLCSKWDSA
jgi:hypothetical protein